MLSISGMFKFSNILMVLFFIVFIVMFVGALFMILSPKARSKMLSKQIKSLKQTIDYSKDDLVSLGQMVNEAGLEIDKNILDKNEDLMRDVSKRKAQVEAEAIKVKAGALKDGLAGNQVFCKHCGALIDEDSKFCKKCGNQL